VVKDLGLKEPYVGIVPLVSGEIAEDVAQYFATSEQTPTVCGLGVLVNPDLTVNVAGGFLIEVLPFASDACIDTIEKNLKTLPPVTTMMTQGMTTDQIALRLLDGLEPNLLDEGEVHYQCDCNRERTERVLKALGDQELTQLIAEGEPVEVNCHFCGKKYTFTPEELQQLRDEEPEE
jgi:molecular chaperone Hsp33